MKFYKDKEVNFKLQTLTISCWREFYVEDQVVEFINKIDPNSLKFENMEFTSISIEAFAKLNCPNINTRNCLFSDSNLLFLNTPIQWFDNFTKWKWTFHWKTIEIYIDLTKMAKIELFETDAGTFLLIPTLIVKDIIIQGKRKIQCEQDIAEQFADLHNTLRFWSHGLIIPIEYSQRIFIKLDDCELHCLDQIEYIYQKFKVKLILLNIKKFDKLLNINKLLPDDITDIRCTFWNERKESTEETKKIEKISIKKIMDNPDLFNLMFIKIFKLSTLPFYEFSFWWKMLSSTRTRLNLKSIRLEFNLLSECLTVLSLCSNCPEIECINLQYLEADIKNENETIKYAKREFRQKFEMIEELNISKN